ncbi:MAG: SCO family protein [Anaerolineales bacterium]
MDRKLIGIGVSILALIGLAAMLTFIFAKPPSFRGALYEEPFPSAPEFELTKSNGEVFRMSSQRGKIVLLFFGYTSCPDICPTTLAEMSQVMNGLGDASKNVQVVFVSVDPARDTPEKIQEYASRFNPTFIGLSGSEAELEPIWQSYSIFRAETETNSAMGVIIDHTARLNLIDADGNLRLSYAYGTPVEDIIHDLELLLGK